MLTASSNKQTSRMSVINKSRNDRDSDLLRLTSNFSEDNGEEPVSLARPLSRRERFFKLSSTSMWSFDTLTEVPSTARLNVDQAFERGMLEGLNHRTAARSGQVLKDRVKGTMRTKKEEAELPRSAEDIRPRHEHIQRHLVQVPSVLAPSQSVGAGPGLAVVRSAMLAELRDVYTIVSSLDTRKFDVCASDVRSMFEWYSTFENFLRVYFIASEKDIYAASDIDEWGGLEGVLVKDMRKKEKKRIIQLSDRVESMKRPMIAADKLCGKHVPEMCQRVEDLTNRLTRFLTEEVRQVTVALPTRHSPQIVQDLFHSMIKDMRSGANGRDMILLMSRGWGTNSSEMATWVRNMCGSTTRVSVATWIRKLDDRHMNYVAIFEKAENEYKEIYEELSDVAAEEVSGARENVQRKKRP